MDAEPGFLRRSTVSSVTRQRYAESYHAVEKFVGRPLRDLTAGQLDLLLTEFMEDLFLAGETAAKARYALYGVAHELDIVTRGPLSFPRAKKTLVGFTRKASEPSRDPLPAAAVWASADHFFNTIGGRRGSELAALVLLSFDGYMRPSEALALQTQDFFASGSPRDRHWSVVIAPLCRGTPAKNKQFDDGCTIGAYDRKPLRRLTSALVVRGRKNSRIFSTITLASLEKHFRAVSSLWRFHCTPHALRHAGPSHDFYEHGAAIHDLQLRGRWMASESCRRYTKPARLLRQRALLDGAVAAKGELAAKMLVPRLVAALSKSAD